MGKHDGEVDILGQLVVSLTKELLETNRTVLDLEKRISQLEKRASELETSRNVQDTGETNRRIREKTNQTSKCVRLRLPASIVLSFLFLLLFFRIPHTSIVGRIGVIR